MTTRILSVGILIGIFDGLAAILNAWLRSGIKPEQVFQYIASGLFGEVAFSGGATMMLIGILIHFFIAIMVTMVFFLFYTKIIHARKNYLLYGAIYGILVWWVMNNVIIPLSAIDAVVPAPSQIIISLLIHIFVIGIPISFFASRNR